MTIVAFAFHLCLVIVPIFLFAHIVLVKESWDVSWPYISDGLADILTLIVIAVLISLLDRAFRSKAKAEEPEAPVLLAQAAPAADDSAAAAAEAAAIGVAIALEKAKQRRPAPQLAYAPRLAAVSPFAIDYDKEVTGEVVTLANIEPGPGTWKSYGRLKALQ